MALAPTQHKQHRRAGALLHSTRWRKSLTAPPQRSLGVEEARLSQGAQEAQSWTRGSVDGRPQLVELAAAHLDAARAEAGQDFR